MQKFSMKTVCFPKAPQRRVRSVLAITGFAVLCVTVGCLASSTGAADEPTRRTLIDLTDPEFGNDSGIVLCKRAENGVTFSAVQVGQGDDVKFRVVVDDKLKPYEGILLNGSLILGLKGERFGYAVKVDGKQRFVIDDVQQPLFDGVDPAILKFNPAGTGHAYFAQNNNRWRIVVNGQSGPELDGAFPSSLKYSDDGQHIVYAGELNGKQVVYLNGNLVGSYDELQADRIGFNPEGQVGFIAGKNRRYFAVVAGQKHGDFSRINLSEPIFSPDGKHFAVSGSTDESAWAVIDGIRTEPCEAISAVFFSEDSQHIVYKETQKVGDEWVESLIHDGNRKKIKGRAGGSSFMRPDGRLFYIAGREGRWYMIDGKNEYGPFDGILKGFTKFGTETSTFAAFNNGKHRLYTDGQQGPAFDELAEGSVIIDPQTQSVVYAGIDRPMDKKRVRIVLNGERVASVKGIGAGSLRFSPDGTRLSYVEFQEAGRRVCLIESADEKEKPTVQEGEIHDAILGLAEVQSGQFQYCVFVSTGRKTRRRA